MAAPTTTDLTNFLTTIGVTASGSADLSSLLTSATQEFEEKTGRQKFEGDSSTTAIRYTLPMPTGKSIRLVIADCWAITEVRTFYSGSGTGTVLAEYDDYMARPYQYAQISRPVEAIDFVTLPSVQPGSILITGKLGYASSMPKSVFEAILSRAASQLLIQQAGESGTVAEEKQGDRNVKYSTDDTVTRFRGVFDRAVARYMKVIG